MWLKKVPKSCSREGLGRWMIWPKTKIPRSLTRSRVDGNTPGIGGYKWLPSTAFPRSSFSSSAGTFDVLTFWSRCSKTCLSLAKIFLCRQTHKSGTRRSWTEQQWRRTVQTRCTSTVRCQDLTMSISTTPRSLLGPSTPFCSDTITWMGRRLRNIFSCAYRILQPSVYTCF